MTSPLPAVELFSTSILSNVKVRTRHERYVSVLGIKKIPYVYHDLASDDEAKSRWRRKAKDQQLPGLLVNNEWIGNFDEFEESVEFGELELFLGVSAAQLEQQALHPAQMATTSKDVSLYPTMPYAPEGSGRRVEPTAEEFISALGLRDQDVNDAEVDELLAGIGKLDSRHMPSVEEQKRTYVPSEQAAIKPLRFAKMGNGISKLLSSSTADKTRNAPIARYSETQPSAKELAAEAAALTSNRKASGSVLRQAVAQGKTLEEAMTESRIRSIVAHDDLDDLFASLGLQDVDINDAEVDDLLNKGSIPQTLHSRGSQSAGMLDTYQDTDAGNVPDDQALPEPVRTKQGDATDLSLVPIHANPLSSASPNAAIRPESTAIATANVAVSSVLNGEKSGDRDTGHDLADAEVQSSEVTQPTADHRGNDATESASNVAREVRMQTSDLVADLDLDPGAQDQDEGQSGKKAVSEAIVLSDSAKRGTDQAFLSHEVTVLPTAEPVDKVSSAAEAVVTPPALVLPNGASNDASLNVDAFLALQYAQMEEKTSPSASPSRLAAVSSQNGSPSPQSITPPASVPRSPKTISPGGTSPRVSPSARRAIDVPRPVQPDLETSSATASETPVKKKRGMSIGNFRLGKDKETVPDTPAKPASPINKFVNTPSPKPVSSRHERTISEILRDADAVLGMDDDEPTMDNSDVPIDDDDDYHGIFGSSGDTAFSATPQSES